MNITGPDTDLELGIAGRPFINCEGKRNFPDGEVFTGPQERSVNGHISYSFPAAYGGREVDGIRLRFKKGEVVEFSAEKNEAFLSRMIGMDAGAKRVGEFAFALNPGIQRFTKNILFDEKIGGTIHLALGKGYPESGSKNDSALHWDMICDLRKKGEVYVDGRLFQMNGKADGLSFSKGRPPSIQSRPTSGGAFSHKIPPRHNADRTQGGFASKQASLHPYGA